MIVKQKMLVIGSQRCNGEVEGKMIQSGKIFTITDSKNDSDHFGHVVGSFSVGYTNVNDYMVVPAYYDLDLNIVGNSITVVGGKRLTDKLDLMNIKG